MDEVKLSEANKTYELMLMIDDNLFGAELGDFKMNLASTDIELIREANYRLQRVLDLFKKDMPNDFVHN